MASSGVTTILSITFAAALALTEPGGAQVTQDDLLPPVTPWNGSSRALIASVDDPWITPAEATGLTNTPDYDETVAWLARLAVAAPELEVVVLGMSHEGRDIVMFVATAEGASTPEAVRSNGRPTMLVQAGIHAGEIDGKDAGMMLLRDLTVGGSLSELLRRANLLFVPILNVDGHERRSRYNRVNQRGPLEMGWRTNARNQNLNRDYTKLDTPEVAAIVAALDRWQPDLYFDIHVTDGADYQYDITWSHPGLHGHSPSLGAWMTGTLDPVLERRLREMGHVPGPLIFLADAGNPARGAYGWMPGPRYSDGYGDARHLPTILVENHSLKPYDRRVLGTYVLLETALRVLGNDGADLRAAVAVDRAARPDSVPLTWRVPASAPAVLNFLGIESRTTSSEISGGERIGWTGRPITLEIPWFVPTRVATAVSRPAAYWIPVSRTDIIERLGRHGIAYEIVDRPTEVTVETYRLAHPALAESAFEGRVRVSAELTTESRTETFLPGSARVTTDQPLGDLAVLLLEPGSPDSFFQWGFFLEVLQRTEYIEAYAVEALAERMLAEDADLAREFSGLVTDSTLASPRARLEWIYRRSPFSDQRWLVYPVAREPAR